MKRLAYILLVTLASCTVLEDRSVCPTNFGLTVTRQAGHIYQNGLAWCNVYAADGSRIAESPLDGMNVRDTTLLYNVAKRETVSAAASSREVVSGCVVATQGDDMEELYAGRIDVDCSGEYAEGVIDRVDKQFCNLTVVLAEDALPYAPVLGLNVRAPFDGTVFPSLAAHKGEFLYSTAFDGEDAVVVRLPRQEGEGLALSLVTDKFTASCDLYSIMNEASYDWSAASLADFTVTMSINSVTCVIEVLDWEIEDLGDREF